MTALRVRREVEVVRAVGVLGVAFAWSVLLAPPAAGADPSSDLLPVAFDPNTANVACVATDNRGPGDDVVAPCPVEAGGPNWHARSDASVGAAQWTAHAAADGLGANVEADANIIVWADLTSVGTNTFSLQLDGLHTDAASTCSGCGPPPPAQLQMVVMVDSWLGRYSAACDLGAEQTSTPTLPDDACRITLENDPAPALLVGDGPFRVTLFIGTFARVVSTSLAGSTSASSSGAVAGYRMTPAELPNGVVGASSPSARPTVPPSAAGDIDDVSGVAAVPASPGTSVPGTSPGPTAPAIALAASAEDTASPSMRVTDDDREAPGVGLVGLAAGAVLLSATALGWSRVRVART